MEYLEPENSLSDEQRRETEQRILHDALLIRDSAHITELGTLAVTWVQLEKARLTGDPLYSPDVGDEDLRSWLMDVFPEDPPKSEWLDEPLRTKMNQACPGSHLPSWPNSIETARDALAIGRAKTQAMYGVGKKTMEKLESLMGENEYFEWKNEPSIEDIAQYCKWLSQVPALAALPQELIQQGVTVGNMRVVDVIKTPEENREHLASEAGFISEYLYSGEIRDAVGRQVYGEIELFAIKFESLESYDAEDGIDLSYLQPDSPEDFE